MKYYSRLDIYKASNVQFDRNSMTAVSYDWWVFLKEIDGLIVFNTYNYSSTTNRHQGKVRNLLTVLGIEIDLFIEAPAGLQNLSAAREHYLTLIRDLKELINKKGTKKAKNEEREIEVVKYQRMILKIDRLKRPAR